MRWLVLASASGDVVGVDAGQTLSISCHARGRENGDPVLEQLEEHLPGARSLYYSLYIWVDRYFK